MNLIKYAVRNIFRHKISSIVVGVSIVFASIIMLLGLSYCNAISTNMMKNTIRTFLGDIQIHNKTDANLADMVVSDKSGLTPIEDYKSIISELKKDKEVQYAVPRIQMAGAITFDGKSVGGVIVGVEAEDEFKMSSHIEVVEGRLLKKGENGILLTKKNEKKFGVKVGDTVGVSRVNKDGAITQVSVPVVGIVEAPGIEPFVSHMAYLNFESANKLNNIGDKVTNLVILLKEGTDLDGFMDKWKGAFDKNTLQADSYKTLGVTYASISQTFEIAVLSISSIIFILILLYVLNISLMAVYQRIKEIGTLSAIGTGSFRIMMSIIFEFLFLGILASSIGVITGSVIVSVLSLNGIPAGSESMAAVYGGNYLYLRLDSKQIVETYIAVCTVCILASIVPAFKATRIQPIEAIRTE